IIWFNTCDVHDIKLDRLMLVAPVRNVVLEDAITFFPYPIPKDLKANEFILAAPTNDPHLTVEEAIRLQTTPHIGMQILENAG
ncbi:serine hydrolase family protein, partial [Aliarcobacter butzleri]